MLFPALLLMVSASQPLKIDVGEVDLFGQTGLDEAAIRKIIPFKPGDSLSIEQFAQKRVELDASIKQLLGKPVTDANPVFYDIHGKAMIFIGLPGPTVREPRFLPAPMGSATLPGEGAALYKALMDGLQPALAAGKLKEDDSQGYALFSDPGLHDTGVKMRSYALKIGPEIAAVLQTSASADQRQAAAMLLGYAERSPAQLQALARAVEDPDSTVRNNATRALMVAVRSDPHAASQFSATPFVEMLRSGSWTDRNKGSNLVAALTASRDPALLKEIREKALPSLVEMAKWTNPPHAAPARMILGRIAGIDEKQLAAMAMSTDPTALLAAFPRS